MTASDRHSQPSPSAGRGLIAASADRSATAVGVASEPAHGRGRTVFRNHTSRSERGGGGRGPRPPGTQSNHLKVAEPSGRMLTRPRKELGDGSTLRSRLLRRAGPRCPVLLSPRGRRPHNKLIAIKIRMPTMHPELPTARDSLPRGTTFATRRSGVCS
jgi:hypothetical protein